MGKRIVKFIRYMFECLLSVIYPYTCDCLICGDAVDENVQVCTECIKKLKFCSNPMLVTRNNIDIITYSSLYYSKAAKEMIIRLKYKSDFRSGKLLAKYMTETVKQFNLEFDLVTYVPTSRKVMKKRGYNQSRFLALSISENLDKNLIDCLKKQVDTLDQIGLGNEKRWDNLRESFRVCNMEKIKDKKILLVDDVITTGATAYYCAKELIGNGVNSVIVLTAAKSKI
ncbi:MAG: ComF family protein [Bacillota bacterium]|nr:ComF family protein [Bacillota bacterium]